MCLFFPIICMYMRKFIGLCIFIFSYIHSSLFGQFILFGSNLLLGFPLSSPAVDHFLRRAFVMIFLVGGMSAPGYYWLSMSPLVFGFVFGIKWSLMGGTLATLSYILLIYFDAHQYSINIISDPAIFEKEKNCKYLFIHFGLDSSSCWLFFHGKPFN